MCFHNFAEKSILEVKTNKQPPPPPQTAKIFNVSDQLLLYQMRRKLPCRLNRKWLGKNVGSKNSHVHDARIRRQHSWSSL